MRLSDVGTLHWAQRSKGGLSRMDKAELLRQGIALQLKLLPVKWRRRMGLSTASKARLDLSRLAIPDSAVARRAEELLQETCPPHLVNHSYRSYAWSTILAQHDGVRHDAELLYVGCLLHDVGLSGQAGSTSRCFTVDSAKHAADIACEAGWTQARSNCLAEAITLHLNPMVSLSHGSEAHLLNAGAALDVTGLRKWDIAPTTVDGVLQRYPRQQFKKELDGLMRAQLAGRPCCRIHFLYSKLKFGSVIRHAPFAE